MRISVISVLVVGLLAGVAAAQPPPHNAAAQAAFADGQQRYAAGEYLAAAAKFEAAYAADPDPVYLFNVAQAYRLGNACPKAVTFYERFLAAVPNPPNLAKVNQYLEQARVCARTTLVSDPGIAVNRPIEPVVTEPVATEHVAVSDPGRTKRWLGIGGMVVGGAAIAVGIYYTAEASWLTDDRADARATCPCEPGYADEIDADGAQAQLRARISYAVGGAAVIGGVVLYMLGRSSESSSVAIVPTAGGAFAVGALTF